MTIIITFSPQRIIDYVPLTIEHELNQTFVNNLQFLLFSNVTQEGETPGRLEELVQESPGLRERRRTLETRKTDLLKIKQKLETFWSLTQNDPFAAAGSSARRTRRSSSAVSTTDRDSYHSASTPISIMGGFIDQKI